MSENKSHGCCWFEESTGRWWLEDPEGGNREVQFDPDDGTRLNADGSTTERVDVVTFAQHAGPTVPMVPAVTAEDVRGNSLFDLLREAASDRGAWYVPGCSASMACDWLVAIGIMVIARQDDGPAYTVNYKLTDAGRTIYAALSGGLAAGEDTRRLDVDDRQLLDAVRLIDKARADGVLTVVGIFKDSTPEGRVAKLNALGELCWMTEHNPQRGMTDTILGTAEDIRRHIAAQSGEGRGNRTNLGDDAPTPDDQTTVPELVPNESGGGGWGATMEFEDGGIDDC